MATVAPMNRAREPCRSQWGALRSLVTRKSTSKLKNQAQAPQSAAAARILRFRATQYRYFLRPIVVDSLVEIHDGHLGNILLTVHTVPTLGSHLAIRPDVRVVRGRY